MGLFVASVLLGGGCGPPAFLSDRCLSIDEAMLALNLVDRTPRQLFDQLDYNQGAPIGFLLAAKASVAAFGYSEWALRLVPFLASLFGFVAFAWVARRLLPPFAALLAVALFAVSPHLVSYAGECKQYASDAAIAIGLIAVALSLLEGKGGFGRCFALTVAGAGGGVVFASRRFRSGRDRHCPAKPQAVCRDRLNHRVLVGQFRCELLPLLEATRREQVSHRLLVRLLPCLTAAAESAIWHGCWIERLSSSRYRADSVATCAARRTCVDTRARSVCASSPGSGGRSRLRSRCPPRLCC